MADRFWSHTVKSLLRGYTRIVGSFGTNGASAPLPASVSGKGFETAVSRTAVGEYVVTLGDIYRKLLAVTASLQMDTPDGSYCAVGAFDKAAKTIVLKVYTAAGVAVDLPASANNRVHFDLALTTSTVD